MTSNFNDSDLYQYPPFNQHRADPIWNRDSDYLIPVVSSVGNGPKGDKGDPLVFDDLTDEQMQKILQDANYVGNKAEEATYITGSGTTSVIEIPIADFDQFDMLFVDIEGLDLHEGADYDIVGNNIILNTPITHGGTKVHFKALSYTLIDGDKTIENVMGHHDYDTVATMKLDTDIELGAICHTLGFRAKGDKGAAWYKVTDDAIATETDVISLDNGYYAIMYKDDESVNPEMLGVFDYTLTEWAGTTQSYSKRTVVYWGSSAYTARQDVPTGIQITNEEYWVPWVGNEALHLELERIDDNLIKKAFSFNTVADMKVCRELYAGAICHTNGFHTSGDGGAAWYEISATGTANEKNVIACGDLFANLILTEDYIIPEQIGCVRTNATEHVQFCCDNYRKVMFAKKDDTPYIITDTIDINYYAQQLFGNCEDDERLIEFQSGSTAQNRKALFNVQGQGCIFNNLSIYTDSSAIVFSAKTDIADIDMIVKNCFIRHCYLILDFEGRGVHFHDNMCASFYNGLIFNWNQDHETNVNNPTGYGQRAIRIENNRFHAFTHELIRVESGFAYGLVFSGNLIDHGRGSLINARDGANSWRVENNTLNNLVGITGVNPNAIMFADADKSVIDCVFVGNIVRSGVPNYYPDHDAYPIITTFIRFISNVVNCIIANNTIEIADSHAIRCDGDVSGLIVNGNSFIGNADTSALLFLYSASAEAAAAKTFEYMSLIGNIANTNGTKSYTLRIAPSATVNHCKVSGNVTKDGTQAVGVVEGTDCLFDFTV